MADIPSLWPEDFRRKSDAVLNGATPQLSRDFTPQPSAPGQLRAGSQGAIFLDRRPLRGQLWRVVPPNEHNRIDQAILAATPPYAQGDLKKWRYSEVRLPGSAL